MNIAIEQNTLLVPPQLAAEIGLDEAIVLQQLHYWLEKAKEKSLGRVVNGVLWVYNSLDRWLEQFPFLSKFKLRRAFANLQEQGLVLAEKMNRSRYDHTMFRTINYERLKPLLESICGPQHIDGEVSNTIDDSTDCTSKTEITPETTSEKKGKPPKIKKKEPDGFEEWYQSALILGWVSGRNGTRVQMARGLYIGRYFHWQEVAKNQKHFLEEPAPWQKGQFLRALAKGFAKK